MFCDIVNCEFIFYKIWFYEIIYDYFVYKYKKIKADFDHNNYKLKKKTNCTEEPSSFEGQ